MSEQTRKEFEEWFSEHYWMEKKRDGEYKSITTMKAWSVWQASRQSLVVKLPEGDGDECGWVVSLVDVEDALDTAGVRYE